ncbi:MAG: intradiol ring-cleavage dioxygenase [Ignavibacteriae bacterium]|nr:intradiol ring-cleavage dioxygenase [Ignavibacteriota bacterium]
MNSLTIICLLMVALVPACAAAQEIPPFPPPPADISSTATVVTADEPGEWLNITGRVYKADGKTPYAGMVLYLYQTDASGVYNKTDNSWQRPRLHAWVKTGKDGHYTINTIKPGAYPGRRDPAHIHVIVQLPGEHPKWIDDFLFERDPYLSERDVKSAASKGTFSHIMKTQSDNKGVLHAVRNIILQ